MPSPYEPPFNADYLFARLTVNSEDKGEERFQRGMKITERTVFGKKLNWKLIRSGRRAVQDDKLEYVHLWQTESPIDLWQGLYTVATDSDYAELYRSVDYEIQDILRFASVYSPLRGFEPATFPRKYFAIQELKLHKDWFVVQDWQYQVPSTSVMTPSAPPGFELAFCFQSVTGKLRSHFHFSDSSYLDPAFGTNWKPTKGDTIPLRTNPQQIIPVVEREPLRVYEVVEYQNLSF